MVYQGLYAKPNHSQVDDCSLSLSTTLYEVTTPGKKSGPYQLPMELTYFASRANGRRCGLRVVATGSTRRGSGLLSRAGQLSGTGNLRL